MRFQVTADCASYESAAAFTGSTSEESLSRLLALLTESGQNDAATLVLQAPPSQGSLGADFSPLTGIERVIVDFLRQHDKPETVILAFPDKEYAKTAKVVYNCWFAVSKADRLLEDGWD